MFNIYDENTEFFVRTAELSPSHKWLDLSAFACYFAGG